MRCRLYILGKTRYYYLSLIVESTSRLPKSRVVLNPARTQLLTPRLDYSQHIHPLRDTITTHNTKLQTILSPTEISSRQPYVLTIANQLAIVNPPDHRDGTSKSPEVSLTQNCENALVSPQRSEVVVTAYSAGGFQTFYINERLP
jgi:hypothetical protein